MRILSLMVNVISQVLKGGFMKKMLVILVSLLFTVMLVSISYSADAKPAETKPAEAKKRLED